MLDPPDEPVLDEPTAMTISVGILAFGVVMALGAGRQNFILLVIGIGGTLACTAFALGAASARGPKRTRYAPMLAAAFFTTTGAVVALALHMEAVALTAFVLGLIFSSHAEGQQSGLRFSIQQKALKK